MTGVLQRLGEERAALPFIAALERGRRDAGDDYAVFRAGVQMAEACIGALDFESAAEFLAELRDDRGAWGRLDSKAASALAGRLAAATWPGTTAPDLAVARVEAAFVVARLWSALGLYEPALALCEAALEAAANAATLIRPGDIALFMAGLHLDRGDLRSAENLVEVHRPAGGPLSSGWAVVEARRLALAGRLSEARRMIEGPDRAAGDGSAVARTLMLAHVLAVMNRLGDAETLLGDAMRRHAGGSAPGIVKQLQEMLDIVRAKRLAAVSDLVLPFVPEQVLMDSSAFAQPPFRAPAVPPGGNAPPARSRERFLDEWSSRANRVLFALQARRLDDARAEVDGLEAFSAETDSPRILCRTRYYKALVDYYTGAYEIARDSLEICDQQAAGDGLLPDQWEYVRVLRWVSARRGDEAVHERYGAEEQVLQDRITGGLDDDDRVFFLLNKWSVQDEYIASQVRSALRVEPAPRLGFLGRWLQRLAVRRRKMDVYRALNCLVGWNTDRKLQTSAPPREGIEPDEATTGLQVHDWVSTQLRLLRRTRPMRRSSLTSRWLLWRIPRSVALLQFYVVPDRIFVFLLTRHAIRVEELPVTRIELDESVRRALSAIMSEGSEGPAGDDVRSVLEGLAQLLGLEDLLGALPATVSRLALIPHDVLVHAPFAALPVGGQLLCHRFALSCLPSLTWFRPAAYRRRRAVRPRHFVGIGISDYAEAEQPPLPQAVNEVRRLEKALALPPESVRVLTNREAEPAAVIEGLSEADWAHFACHGKFDVEAPHSSGLIVSGRGGAATITLAEIQTLDLRKLKLAILAACWLSSSAVLPGNELVCMPAAFLRAGARSVVSPLWEVDDEVNPDFMVDLYAAVQKEGIDAGLATVQRAWSLRSDGREHPFYWAAYVAYGSSS